MGHLTRREFSQGLLGTFALLAVEASLGRSVAKAAPTEETPAESLPLSPVQTAPAAPYKRPVSLMDRLSFLPQRREILFDIWGLHDAPQRGGSSDPYLALDHFRRLGVKSVKSIHPEPTLLKLLSENGIYSLARAEIDGNRFVQGTIEEITARAALFMDSPLIQPQNETNLLGETNNVFRPPEEHVEMDFLPSAIAILDAGGIPVTTPVAQKAFTGGVHEFDYYQRMWGKIVESPQWERLDNNLVLGVHAYTFEFGKNPLDYVTQLQDIGYGVFGKKLPICVLEGGPFYEPDTHYNEEQYAAERLRTLQLPIPNSLQDCLIGFYMWIYANYAQKWPDGAGKKPMPHYFETPAIYKLTGQTPSFWLIEEFAKSRR